MYLCTVEVVPRSVGRVVAAEVDALVSELRKSGQLVGNTVAGRSELGYRITGIAPQPDALDSAHHSAGVERSWERLTGPFGSEIDVTVEAHDEPPVHAASLEVATELYLVVYPQWHYSPLLSDSGLFVPTYLLPIGAEARAAIFEWANLRRNLLELEAGASSLERPAAKAVSSATGSHADSGRGLCRGIESATKLPVFYGLYCPTDLSADLEACAECEQPLEVRVGPYGDRLRVCEACRLAVFE